MSKEVFAPTHPRRSWIFLLPLLLASIALLTLSTLRAWQPAAYSLVFLGLTVVLAMAEGLLVARELPEARARETQARQLAAVYQVISKAGSSLQLQEVLDAITRLTVEVTGVRGCSIKLLDEGGSSMRVRSLAGIQREVAELKADAAQSLYARSLLEGEPVRVEGAQSSDFPELDEDDESLLCVPLRKGTEVVGALCLYSEKGRGFPPEMLSFLSRLGDLVTISIGNASVYESLKKIDQTKTWFLLKASHELKSPLGSIQSICRTILEGYLGDLTPKVRELIERIRYRSGLLLETATDLLALARTRSEILAQAMVPVDLCAALEETLGFYRPAAAEKGVGLEISAPCTPFTVSATQEGVRSIMSNLVSNAIKYSAEGSTVIVALETGENGARLTVIDHGIGIPDVERENLFHEFFRASNARSMTDAGTGLGLAVVKSVLDQLGGSIDIQSELGKGTTVRVSLPGRG